MKTTNLPLRVALNALVICVSIVLFVECTEASPSVDQDHLIPTKGEIDQSYQAVLKRKLFVSPADYGRATLLPSDKSGEYSIAIYSNSHSKTGVSATCTKSAANLGNSTWEMNPKRIDQSLIKVTRADVPFPKSTAVALSAAWTGMLAQTREREITQRAGDVVVDGLQILFSVDNMSRQKTEGILAPDSKGRHTAALRRLSELLSNYCEVNSSRRGGIATEIECEANRLVAEIRPRAK
jgi:hypothetical protein